MQFDGLFGLLNNVVWTDRGARSGRFRYGPGRIAAAGERSVRSVDKFPPMLDYVVPEGSGGCAAVRLGAHLASTTVMHEGSSI
jgi:2,3,4,5-tetrahydropyridine-2-carboxylate N-succinyltransferase